MSIGDVLAEARSRAGLSVAQVSWQTRIRQTLICDIERDDYSRCGGDFYARGHIRAIARAVGADPGPLIDTYDTARSLQAPPAEVLPRPAGLATRGPRRRNGEAAVPGSPAARGGRGMARDAGRRPGTGGAASPVRRRCGRRRPAARRLSLRLAVAAAGVAVLVGVVVAWVGPRTGLMAPALPGVAWALSPASNTVAIRLTPGGGPAGRQVIARSRVTVSEPGTGRLSGHSRGGQAVRVPVPPGKRTRLLVAVYGPRPFHQMLTVTAPAALRVLSARHGASGLRLAVSSPLLRVPHRPLCGTDQVSFPAPQRVVIARSPQACTARLRLTAQDGEQAVVPVGIPALPQIPLYSFARPAGRAIYITIDDGWTPSPQVLALMRSTHLPVTAFLIAQAARQDLPYWRAFAAAGGAVGDHTLSHPDLTKLTLPQATAQWRQARRALGRWLGHTPALGRPPYGDFDPAVQAAAYRAGLKALVGWSATVAGNHIQTWNGAPLEPGEIVLLHWQPSGRCRAQRGLAS